MKKYLTLTEYRRKQRSQRDREAVAGLIQNRGMGFVPSIGAGPTGASIFTVDGVALSDDDIDVNTGDTWTLNGDGSATLDTTSTNRRLRHTTPAPLSTSTNYEVTFTIDIISAGSFRLEVGSGLGTIRSTADTFTETIASGAATLIGIKNQTATTAGTISNIIVTEV